LFFKKKLEKGFETDFLMLFGLKPSPTLPKTLFFKMQEQFQNFIGLWKTCPKLLKDNRLSFEVIHNFHKS